MKILFDECIPQRLRSYVPEHTIVTVPEAGWAGMKNGELIKKASGTFDVFVTVDRNLSFQQNPATLSLPVIVIHSRSNKLKDLESFIPQLLKLLQTSLSDILYHIEGT